MQSSTKRLGASAAMMSLSLWGAMPPAALAQQSSSTAVTSTTTMDVVALPQAPQVWDISLGAGTALSPTYAGSNRYEAAPVLLANVTYRNMLSLGAGGLSAYWHQGGLRIGVGLTFNGGRKDHEVNGLFERGDDRLKGLGDIDTSLGVRAFATYSLGSIQFDGAVTKLTRAGNDGLFANMGASAPYRLSGRFTVTPHLITTWANRSYTQTYFGITAAQAADSAFPEFNAAAGFMNITAGVDVTYSVSRHWFVKAGANVIRLTGDAARSPIAFSDGDALVSLVAGYHF